MFTSFFPSVGVIGAGMAGASAAVSAAIAYARGMESSRVTVTHVDGVLYLDGTASSYEAMETALNIAHDIGGCRVYNRIEPAY